MKKIVIILSIVMIAFSGFAQRTITDTLQGNETVNFTAMQDAKQIQVLATQLGGTSDGTIVLKGSTDGTTYTTLQPTADMLYYFPSDTAQLTGYTWTITNGGSLQILLDQDFPDLNYFRITGAGTASDTTLITIKWSK